MQGVVHLGTEPSENGFADEIGDLAQAIERAAERSDGIKRNQHEVTYFEESGFQFSLSFADLDVETYKESIVYIDTGGSSRVKFVEPTRSYAAWSVPATAENASVEVVANG